MAPENQLEGVARPAAAGLLPGGFSRTQEGWAQFYGIGERTLKRWVAQGKKAQDICPFGEPDELVLWLARHVRRDLNVAVQEKIQSGARRLLESAASSGDVDRGLAARAAEGVGEQGSMALAGTELGKLAGETGCQGKKIAGVSSPLKIDNAAALEYGGNEAGAQLPSPASGLNARTVGALGEMGFDELLRAARRRAAKLNARLEEEESRAEPDEGKLTLLGRQFSEAMENMRKLELASKQVLAEAGRYGLVADMVGEVAKIHQVLMSELFGLWEKVEAKGEGKFLPERKAIWRAEFNGALARLQGNKFAAGLALPPEPEEKKAA